MAITPFDKNVAIIQALSDLPNVSDLLTPAQLKAKFDEGARLIKEYLLQMAAEIDAQKATKAEVQGIVLGALPDGSITQVKLAFAVATQTDLQKSSVGSTMYAYQNFGGF